MACLAGLGLLLALGVWRTSGDGGFTIERGNATPEVTSQGSPTSAASSGSGQGQPADSHNAAAASGADAESQAGAGRGVARVVVHVDGAVASPGVYELAGDDPRVGDAVKAAGGLTGEADTSTINLAAKVTDGSKVHVPVAGEAVVAPSGATGQTAADASATGSQAGTSSDGGSGDSSPGGLVNINTATADELDSLPGIGPSTAQAIVEDRQRNGPFSSPEDLMRVSGIGEKKFAKLRGSICV